MRKLKENELISVTNNKLRNVKTTWGKREKIEELTRQEAQIVTRIGHTRLTHGHLMDKTNP